MEKNIYNLSKEFIEIYDGLEPMLDAACTKAKTEVNADIMQKLTDLADTSRFIMSDFLQFNEILEEIKLYLKPNE
jgi:hypothetical protein